jgi:hypothetical protein
MATGLPTLMNTMGIVDVWRLAATDAVEPVGTNKAAPRRITSVTALVGVGVAASSPDNIEYNVATFNQAGLVQT